MEKIKFLGMASLMVLATCMTSCSSDDNNGDEEKPSQKYTWSTDGGIKACDHLLFSEVDNSEDVNGTQIGNGDAEFVFKGKQTLKKGTYILKGWVYIANGAELTIEPGTIIKPNNLIGFGRKLGYIHGLKHKRSATGTKYLVKRI